jgi:membrane protein DedA with SNARE-associated domain
MDKETLKSLVADYGYLAIFIGCFLEGETILVLGGFAAYSGYLDLGWVMVSGFTGSFLGDQLYYFVARKWGNKVLNRFPSWRAGIARALRLLEKYDVAFILSFRFIYGVRSVSSVAIGLSSVPPHRFLPYNCIAAAVWAVCVAGLGYVFGEAINLILEKVANYEMYFFGGLAFIGLSIWATHRIRRNRRNARAAAEAAAKSAESDPVDLPQAPAAETPAAEMPATEALPPEKRANDAR